MLRRIGYSILTSIMIVMILSLIFSSSPITSGGTSSISHSINTTETRAYIMVSREKLVKLLNYTCEKYIVREEALFRDAIVDCQEKVKVKTEPPLKMKYYVFIGNLNYRILQILNLSRIEIKLLTSIPEEYFSKYLDEKQLKEILETIDFEGRSSEGEFVIYNYTSYDIILIAFEETGFISTLEMEFIKAFKIDLLKTSLRVSLISLIGIGIIVLDQYLERRKRSEKQ